MSKFVPTPNQQALIDLVEGCHLVQAPPGSGKTQVLTHRIIRLLTSDGEATFRILGLTFTTKAAETLRKRVKDAAGEASRRVRACTFHSFCLDALQHYGHFVGFPPDTTIYDADVDRLDVLARAVEDQGYSVPNRKELRELMERIGMAKRALREPDSYADDPPFAEVYGAYNRILRQFHACDFDDLLWLTWRMLTDAPKVAKHYRRRFRYIMVDEAQDTSRAQYEILRALCGDTHRNVMLVADNDQFIYRFAGASDRWLAAFQKDFGATKHELNENFRCAKRIVEVANALVADQPVASGTRGSMSAVHAAASGRILAGSYQDEEAEAGAVASWVTALLNDGLPVDALAPTESPQVAPEDICILARNRYSLDAVMAALGKAGVPVLFRAGRQLVESPEAQLALQGLKLIQNPADLVTRESILARWSEDLLDTTVSHLPVVDYLRRVGEASLSVRVVTDVLEGGADQSDVSALVRALAGVLDGLAGDARNSGEEERAASLTSDAATLRTRWREYSGHTAPDTRSVGAFLGELALGGKSVIEGPGIRVLTIHVAKGLEFKAVAVVGMNDGTLPDYRSLGHREAIADERRIAYVAITRASRVLLLTRPRLRLMPWGDTKRQGESRFIGEMGLSMEHR